MSIRIGPRTLAVALTGAWLLAAPESARAQSTPTPTGAGGLAVLSQIRDKFSQELEAASRDYDEFRKRTPVLFFVVGPNMYTDRLAKIESRRSELRTQLAVLQENHNLVKRIAEKDGNEIARKVLAALGIKIADLVGSEKLDKELIELKLILSQKAQVMGPNHPDIKALGEQIELIKRLYSKGASQLDDVKHALAIMAGEIDSKKILLQALDARSESEQKAAAELRQFELENPRLCDKVDAARKALGIINQVIKETERPRGPSK